MVLSRFDLSSNQLVTLQDKWLYAFKHLHELDHIPSELQESIFQRLFAIAQIAQLPAEERQVYETSLKDYRDFMSAQDTAHLEGYQEGMEEGIEVGKRETARRLLAKGMSVALVAELVDLSIEAVQVLV